MRCMSNTSHIRRLAGGSPIRPDHHLEKAPLPFSCARHLSKFSSQASSDCVHCWPQPDLGRLVCHLPCTCTLAGSLNVWHFHIKV